MAARFYARPVIALVSALATGVAAGSLLPGLALPAGVAAVAVAGRIGLHWRRRQPAACSPLLLYFLLGYLSLQPWLVPNLPPEHVLHLADDAKRRFTGHLIATPRQSGRRVRCIVALESVKTAGEGVRPVSGRIRLTLFDGPPELRRGDRVAFFGRIRTFHNFNNPGGFDYRRFMAFRRVHASSWSNGSQVEILDDPVRSPLDGFRNRTAARIDAAAADDANAILRTLVLGDRSRIRPQLNEAFRRTGISHLLAISGLHIGIVAATAFLLLRKIFSRFDRFLWNASVQRHAAAWALLPAALYALIAGMSPSTQRALIMVSVFMATFMLRKEHDLVNTLAAAAMVILIAHPPSIFSVSFQLSFAAVAAIVFGMRVRLSDRQASGRKQPLVRRLADRTLNFVAVSVLATLGTLPLIMGYFHQVSLIGIAANCLFVPWIGFGTVPLALAATFAEPVSPAAAHWLMQAAAALVRACLPLIEWIAARPFAAMETFGVTAVEILGYYSIFGLILAWLFLRSSSGPAETTAGNAEIAGGAAKPLPTGRRWIAAGLMIAGLTLAGDISYWVYQRFFCRDLRITLLDVGRGNAALIEMPQGRCMLIDGGGFPDNRVFDIGARVVAPYLRKRKIRTIDTLVLSHPNSDHLNGLLYIAEHFRIGRLWSNGQSRRTFGYRRLTEIVAEQGIPHPAFADLPRCRHIDGVTVELLHPPAGFRAQSGKHRSSDLNNNSIVMKISYGSTAVLFPGDIEAEAEAELTATAAENLPSDVLLIPHHGSGSSSTSQWIAAVDPVVAVISVRENSHRKLPHPTVLQRLRERGLTLLRTDRHGAVELNSDGRSLEVDWVRQNRLEAAIGGLPLANYWYRRAKW